MESDILFTLSISLILGLLSSKLMKMIKMPNVTGYLIIDYWQGLIKLNILSIDVIEKFSIIPDVALGFIAFSIEQNLNYHI